MCSIWFNRRVNMICMIQHLVLRILQKEKSLPIQFNHSNASLTLPTTDTRVRLQSKFNHSIRKQKQKQSH